jgi:hypothetical protein
MRTRLRVLTPAAAAAIVVGAVAVDVVLSACRLPTSPTPPRVLPVTITAEGFVASGLTGGRAMVEFFNNDLVAHEIRSDPHPEHSQCPELNVGVVSPGQRVAILSPLNSGRVCGFHDETKLNDPRFRAVITVQ